MRLEKDFQKTNKRGFFAVAFLVAWISLFLMNQNVCAANETVIRVGYDGNSNFIKKGDGGYYGYGVEYLEKMAEYTGWKCEYVNVDGWTATLDALRNGEIDMVATAHYTKERAKEFVYSEIPLGHEISILYTKPDSKISYQDYEAMQGCKIGLLEDSYSAQEFLPHAEEVNINYKGIYFRRYSTMKQALQNGMIDMMVVGSRYATPELKLVDVSGSNAFYCIAQPENSALIKEVDRVLLEIKFDEPTFEGGLNARYLGHEAVSSSPLYTKEEQAYIESVGSVKIKLLQDQKPSCYMENGKIKGIWIEVIKLLSQKSGIDFVVEIGDVENYSQELYEQYIEDGYLLLRTQNALQHMSEEENTIVSNALASVSVAYVKRQEAFVEDEYVSHAIALTKDLAYMEAMLLEENPNHQVQYFENTKECLEALLNKDVCMAIQNSHRVSYLMQKPEYTDKLVIVPGVDHGNKVCLVAPENEEMLIGIINKAIHHITYAEINEIVARELLMNPYPLGFDDFLYQNWNWVIMVAALMALVLILYAVFTNHLAAAKIEKKEYELLQKKVQLDELTGLYNRTHFYELARKHIDESDEEMCIVAMDIMNFRAVNELYGISAGDRVLKEIGRQIKNQAKLYPMLPARFMADHYYMCMSKADFERAGLPKSFKTFLEDMEIKVVYGVFFIEKNKDISVNVMCDRALLAARDHNYKYIEYIHFYNDSACEQERLEQDVENEMEKALKEQQFFVVVQPKYNSITEEIVGGEALVRWKHPEKGMISPGIFIKIFEKNGFIIQLDYFVWEETCRLLAQMKEKGLPTVPISINVSRAHFYGNELEHKLCELVQKYALEAGDIELEITESVCGESFETIFDRLRKLQEDGFKIAMDDFGSGYSSLNMLKEMPLDIIKMDLKFLDGEQSKGQLILKALIEMAQTIGLKVVVEGVELLSQVEFLRQFKNCSIQGYYFSRPIETGIFEEMVKKQK